jgi:thiol:disulfide interchange protein DsbD
MPKRLLFLFVIGFACSALAAEELLEPDRAFKFSARALDPASVEVRYEIAEGYYLYRDKFRISASPGEVKPGPAAFPSGQIKDDEFFGKVETYRRHLRFTLPVEAPASIKEFKLTVTSQGCADIGVCYPPNPQTVAIKLTAFTLDAVKGGNVLAEALRGEPAMSQGPSGAAPVSGPDADESSRIAHLMKTAGFWLIVSGFFGFGILLAGTPCVFPMIPILSGIIAGQGHKLTKSRSVALSVAYVLGMAVTHAALGVAAGLSGTMLSAAMQSPWVLGSFAAVFVLLALSMFGFYELQMPSFLQSRLSETASHQRGGSLPGVTLMGVLSAIIVGPCVAAPLAGALLYIAQTRDALLGGTALFSMALGMGLPLIVVGLSAGALLPKAGPWMEGVQRFFGVTLLGVAIWMISPLLAPALHMLAWAALLILSAIYLHALDPLPPHAQGWHRFWKGIGVVALLVGASLVIGVLAGSRDILQPLAVLRGAAATRENAIKFERVRTAAELDARLKAARQPVMLDFYADWCVSCKEMERFTFADAQVRARMQRMLLLQADVTDNTAADKDLLQRFGLFGPPGIVFFDSRGAQIPGLRVIGFQEAERFAAVLDQALAH